MTDAEKLALAGREEKARAENRTAIVAATKAWKTSQGKGHYLKYLDGKRLTQRQAILAKCASCCCGHADGKIDCGVPTCPLYPFMPYREKG